MSGSNSDSAADSRGRVPGPEEPHWLSDDNLDDVQPFDVLEENLDPDAEFRLPWGYASGFRLRRPKPYRKDEHDAITRRWLAFWVLGIVSALYGAAVVGMLCHWINIEELGRVALVLGPIQALAAAVLGFYFGRDNKA